MGQCNTQTNHGASGVVTTLVITKREPPSQPTPRGLELIKSCAKLYANGVGVKNPRPQLSHRAGAALNEPATGQASPSRRSKTRIRTFAVMCTFILVLPSLSLAIIVWWAATNRLGGRPELAASDPSAVSAQLSPAGTAWDHAQAAAALQSAADARSDIVIHKVKTQPITGDAWGEPNRE
jgi:hypothetical protein